MKILQLNLLAFGPFTDTPIDLSEGKEGFHLVFGPNEAGKSSALRALRQMVFGIPERSTILLAPICSDADWWCTSTQR